MSVITANIQFNKQVFVNNIQSNYTYLEPVKWSAVDLPVSSAAWKDVIWDGTQYIAIGFSNAANERLMTSPTGQTWTAKASVNSTQSSFIAYSGSLYMILDSGVNIYTSTDLITWTDVGDVTGSSSSLGLYYADGLFILLGNSNRIETSTDGTTWTLRTTADTDFTFTLYGYQYLNGVHVVSRVGDLNNVSVLRSTDGITWSEVDISFPLSTAYMATGASLFIIMGRPVSGTKFLFTSTDGTTWTSYDEPEDALWELVAFGNNVTVLTKDAATSASVNSLDLSNYTSSSFGDSYIIDRLKYLNGRFIALTRVKDKVLIAEFVN